MSDNIYWLWLSLSCDATVGNQLVDRFGSPYQVFQADEEVILDVFRGKKIPLSVRELLRKDLSGAQRTMNYCFTRKIGILTMDNPSYPAALRQIEKPPLVLYYRGKLLKMDKHFSLAVVGTRSMSTYGESVAFSIAHDLARAGTIIISGLARGVDGVAAAAAIAAGGKTVAILGSGLDRIYPAEHRVLAAAIMRNGLILSEYPPFSSPDRFHFPERNRIISGLAAGTLLIEGGERSGALITANQSRTMGKPVFAVPGNIDEPNSFAPNYLIHNGAKAVRSADDIFASFSKQQLRNIRIENLLKPVKVSRERILSELSVSSDPAPRSPHKGRRDPLAFRPRASVDATSSVELEEDTPLADSLPFSPIPDATVREKKRPTAPFAARPGANKSAKTSESLSSEENAVFNALPENSPATADIIAREASLGVGKVMSILLMLEIKGYVESLPGGRFRRI